jgi:DNA-binding PadR family transcriptional regulator
VRSHLTTTSYALLGLLAFDEGSTSRGLTGYEVKQRADNTLRFYWVSPAMSQIYTELARLAADGAVTAVDDAVDGRPHEPRRPTRRYRITSAGLEELQAWLNHPAPAPEFPVLKHPVALRLLMGHLMEPDRLSAMLDEYLGSLHRRHAELAAVRESLGDDDAYRYPVLVADWGMAYYDAEESIVRDLLARVPAHVGGAGTEARPSSTTADRAPDLPSPQHTRRRAGATRGRALGEDPDTEVNRRPGGRR